MNLTYTATCKTLW